MAGEMSQSEVTRESYPDLFEIRDRLKAKGIESEPRAFDQYQGPYLKIQGVCKVWYGEYDLFVIERGFPPRNTFETTGADEVVKATDKALKHGLYCVDSAAVRVAALAKVKS